VKILINTVGHPLYSVIDGTVTQTVLASYGVFVTKGGELESPANDAAPTRQVNRVLEPGGYLGTWCRDNGAEKTLTALYHSPYTSEVVFGNESQLRQEKAELVPNTKGGRSTMVGMSMAPSIWLVNFTLIYVLNPSLAADIPSTWAPLPSAVVDALTNSPTGRVPHSEFASLFA
jgi:hypothetical protein